MKEKKSLLSVLFIFILNLTAFCQNDFKILTKPDIHLKTSVVIPTKTSLRNEGPAIASNFSLDFYSIIADSAVYFTGKSTDSVLSFLVKPVSLRFFQLGTGIKYHLYDYFDSFVENDFMLNQYFAFLYRDILKIQLNTGYNIKLTAIKNNDVANPIFYQTILLGLDVFWNINKSIQIFAGANSMSEFDFSLIGTPFYNLGANFKINEKIAVGFNYNMKMIDMVAVAENISEMLLTLYMKVSL